MALIGSLPPEIVSEVPGPRSCSLAARLMAVESRNVTCLDPTPIFWERAAWANVWDVDGNRYVDLTAAFGVANVGHAHPQVVSAMVRQAESLLHGMGDVYPPRIKLELLESLVATGFPYDRTDDSGNNLANLNRFIVAVRGIRRGGSAELDLAYVARGRLDGFWEQGLKTCDVSAGGLIVREAGGVVTNFEGRGWDHRRGDVVASNGLIHEQMLELVE